MVPKTLKNVNPLLSYRAGTQLNCSDPSLILGAKRFF